MLPKILVSLVLIVKFTAQYSLFQAYPRTDIACNAFKQIGLFPSTWNRSRRLAILHSSVHFDVSHRRAQTLCRQCVDGRLAARDDVARADDEFSPGWIGLVGGPGPDFNASDFWRWTGVDGDNSTFSSSDKNMGPVTNIRLPRYIVADTTYGVLGVKRRGEVDWIALPVNNALKTYAVGSYETTQRDVETVRKGLTFLVCQRPERLQCHRWKYLEDACDRDPTFGCHNYETSVQQDPDPPVNWTTSADPIGGDQPGPKCPGARGPTRRAVRCPARNCTCQVGPWSQWSVCGSEKCSVQQSFRNRQRAELDEDCPKNYRRSELFQKEECSIPGCNELRLDGMHPESSDDEYDPTGT